MIRPAPKMNAPKADAVRVVPIEPTRNMVQAAYTLLPIIGSEARAQALCVEVYKAMIEHAPQEKRGGLSHNQRRVHEIVTEFIDANGVAPTYREIARLAGFGGHAEAFRTVRTLKRKGVLTIEYGARGIKLILRPEQT